MKQNTLPPPPKLRQTDVDLDADQLSKHQWHLCVRPTTVRECPFTSVPFTSSPQARPTWMGDTPPASLN